MTILCAISCSHSAWAKKMAIAHFDVVPYQVVEQPFALGVVAFHISGINHVRFMMSDGVVEHEQVVHQRSINKRTKVNEYWVSFDPAEFRDGLITITAHVVPNSTADETRTLQTWLWANSGTSYRTDRPVYVSINGQPEGIGTKEKPFATINQALIRFIGKESGTIVLLDEGVYYLTDVEPRHALTTMKSWLTIKSEDGLDRNKVIITAEKRQSIRLSTNMLCWSSVTIDFKNIRQLYNKNELYWFKDCKWYSSDGWSTEYPDKAINVYEGYYATDCYATDLIYGFVNALLIRNCHIEKISGDALQNSKAVFNVNISGMDGTILTHHSDVYQMFGESDNIILYNVVAVDLNQTQSLFLEPTISSKPGDQTFTLSNMAIVDCTFLNIPVEYNGKNNNGGPPWSQFISRFEHVYIKNLLMPGQRLIMRTDIDHNQKWQGKDILFEDCVFHNFTYRVMLDPGFKRYLGLPEGVTVKNCLPTT